jgi:hypothetical protein
MTRFTQAEFFRLLQNNSHGGNPVEVKKLEKAHKKFAGTLLAENNVLSLFDYRNALCYTRVEFACLQNRDEMKKK